MSLTKAEIKVTQTAADTAMQFSLLEAMHPSDLNDVIFHVHAIQNIVMARSAQRAHPEEFPTYVARREGEQGEDYWARVPAIFKDV